VNSDQFEWNEADEWGVVQIDREHKKLLKTLQTISMCTPTTYTKELKRQIIKELRSYMNFLEYEEKVLESIAYPSLQEHKNIHKKIAQQLSLMLKNISELSMLQSKTKVVAKQLLVSHLAEEDIHVKRYLLKNEITLAEEEIEILVARI